MFCYFFYFVNVDMFRPSMLSMSKYIQGVPCVRNFSYSFILIVLKLRRYFYMQSGCFIFLRLPFLTFLDLKLTYQPSVLSKYCATFNFNTRFETRFMTECHIFRGDDMNYLN